jgi:hypothetical protein
MRDASRVVDADAAKAAKVEHDSTVTRAMPSLAVTAAPDRHGHVVSTRKLNCSHDVLDISAAGYSDWSCVDGSIPDESGGIERLVCREDHRALQGCGPLADEQRVDEIAVRHGEKACTERARRRFGRWSVVGGLIECGSATNH